MYDIIQLTNFNGCGIINIRRWRFEVVPLLAELDRKETGMDYIETVVRYILNVGEEISLKELSTKVKKISAEGSEMIMTIAEKIREDGIKKGRKEGRKEGREEGRKIELIETVIYLLEKKYDEKLSGNLKDKIKNTSRKNLKKIRDNIFDIDSLKNVEEMLQK